MSNYIPRSGGQKKRNILRKRELELRAELRREGPDNRVHKYAEKLRLAQLGVVKALIHEATPTRAEDAAKADAKFEELQHKKRFWEEVSVDDIIDMYLKSIDAPSTVGRKRWWDLRDRDRTSGDKA